MRIVAWKAHGTLFIEVAPQRGRILTADKRLCPEINVHTILNQGYWEEYTGPQDILPALLAEATVIDLPPPEQVATRTEAEVRQWLREKGFLKDSPAPEPEQS